MVCAEPKWVHNMPSTLTPRIGQHGFSLFLATGMFPHRLTGRCYLFPDLLKMQVDLEAETIASIILYEE